MIVIITAVSDAQDNTMIVFILVIIFIMSDHHLASSNILLYILLYIEIKRDVRHPWQRKGCDHDSYQGTSRDAEDVVMIIVMTRMITIITPVPLSSWSSSSLIRQHWWCRGCSDDDYHDSHPLPNCSAASLCLFSSGLFVRESTSS